MLHLIDLVLRQAQSQQPILKKLYQLTRMLSLKMSGVRCSIVHCVSIVEGIVLASHDHEGAFGIELELQKYPEILQVIHTGQLVAIENLSKQPDLAHLVQVEKEIQFNSMILCPLLKKKEFFGVLSLRLPLDRTIILDYEIRFVEVVSQIVNLCLSNASNDVDDLLKALHKGIHGPSVASPLPTEEKPKNAKLLRFKGHRK